LLVRRTKLTETETVTVSSKGQITIPSKLRKQMKIMKGEQLLIVHEKETIKLVPITKLSKLAGVDEELFKGRKPSQEIEDSRREDTKEFEKRLQQN
jgi:AbrB family looped-hinge helix DNA binding protein